MDSTTTTLPTTPQIKLAPHRQHQVSHWSIRIDNCLNFESYKMIYNFESYKMIYNFESYKMIYNWSN